MNTKFSQNSVALVINPLMQIVKNSEYLLLTIVASIGLAGSVFVLSQNNVETPKNEISQFAGIYAVKEKKSDFDKHVKMTGDKKVGTNLHFEIHDLDIKNKRYVMEMGDGRRMIITHPEFDHQYATKGEYILELKELQRGLIVLVGDKKLKIKE